MTLLRSAAIALACACALSSCAAPPTALSGPSMPPFIDPLPTKIERNAAIALVVSHAELLGRVDRTEAKLMTWKELLDASGPPGAVNADPKASPHIIGTLGIMGDPEMRIVWIVAVSGEVWPQLRVPVFFGHQPPVSPTPNPAYRWGLFVVEANGNGLFGAIDAGIDDAWPSVFAKLPDHPAALGATPSADPCASVLHLPDVRNPSRFPARTRADLTTYLPRDLTWMRLTQMVAGVQGSPERDPRVPLCRVDLLEIGTPYFARRLSGTTGRWFVPLAYKGEVLQTAFVEVDAQGNGMITGGRGGAIPVPSEADARAAAALPNDPVTSAELILATPPGCGGDATAVWRLVRASGTAVYFALDVYDAKPPGVLFEEKDMRFSSSGSPRAASVLRAC